MTKTGMAWRRVFAIARREFWATVRRREFVLVTVGLPILYVLLAVIVGGATASAVRTGQKGGAGRSRVVGFVDRSGLLDAATLTAKRDDFSGKVFASESEGQAAVRDKSVRYLVVVPPDFANKGRVTLYAPPRGGSSLSNVKAPDDYVPVLRRALLADKVSPETVDAAVRPIRPTTLTFDPKKNAFEEPNPIREVGRFVVPYAFAMLLVMSVVIGSSYLLHGIAEEKENRVIEVLLSAATHEELLAGKVIGLGAVGLLQLGIWVGGAASTLGLVAARFPEASALVAGPGLIATAVLLFLLGYAVYATLMAGMGAMGTSWRESSQIAGVAVMPLVMPLMLLPVILEQPNGPIAKGFSFFPLTSPIGMMLRVAAGGSSVVEVAVCALLLLATLWLVLRVAARLFRLSLLLYGQRPNAALVMKYLFARAPAS